jgi:hypothetical protein
MAAGDGIVWNEALPDNNTLAHQIDDYNRDIRLGVRSRMAREHVWPASQTGTGEAGHHQFITFQQQTGAPTLLASSGMVGALYVGSSGAGYPLMFENSAGSTVTLVNSAGNLPSIISGGTQGGIIVCSSANANGVVVLAATTAVGYVLTSLGQTAAPSWQSVMALTGTGPTNASAGCGAASSYGPTAGGRYYYFCIGKNSSGQLVMASGEAASGTAIPLPAGCAQADCHWIVSVQQAYSAGFAGVGFAVAIAADRTVTIYSYGYNWVS